MYFCVLSNLRLDSLAFLFESQQGLQGQMNSKDKKSQRREEKKKEDQKEKASEERRSRCAKR